LGRLGLASQTFRIGEASPTRAPGVSKDRGAFGPVET